MPIMRGCKGCAKKLLSKEIEQMETVTVKGKAGIVTILKRDLRQYIGRGYELVTQKVEADKKAPSKKKDKE